MHTILPSPLEINEIVRAAASHTVDGDARFRFLLRKREALNQLVQPGLRGYAKSGSVARFYQRQRSRLTLDGTLECQKRFLALNRGEMSAWDFLLQASQYTDGSDPDHKLVQIQHAWGTAEKSRREKMPEWFTVLCLVHDLGKILLKFRQPQYKVVGDTFPHGVKPSETEIYYDVFQDNPDAMNGWFKSTIGIYSPECGLDFLTMSWGHDEYCFHMILNWISEHSSYVREEWDASEMELRIFLYCLRFHSFYAFHRGEAYQELWSEEDRTLLPFLQLFSGFDLYSKVGNLPSEDRLHATYHPLLDRFFPSEAPLRL